MWRGTLFGSGVAAALLAGMWLGAETLAADRLRQLVAETPQFSAASVRPLRRIEGIGLRLDEPRLDDGYQSLALPWAELSLSPLAPTVARLNLPSQGRLTVAGQAHALEVEAPEARLGVAVLRHMAVDSLYLATGAVRLEGVPAAEGLRLDASLRTLGHDAPPAARASYDAALRVAGLTPEGMRTLNLDPGGIPGEVSAEGVLRLWFDRPPMLGRRAMAPQLVGLQTAGLDLGVGALSLRLIGRLSADAAGRTEGRVAVYTTDGGAIVDHLVDLGLIPEGARLLLRAGLMQLGRAEMEAETGPDYPAPGEDELRLPLVFDDGRMMLGAIPLGPAPRFLP